MKKVLVSIFALAALAGCTSYYDYYRGDVRYTQDGTDCIYYVGEMGNHFNNDVRNMRAGKKVVYRNTLCSDLYARDTMDVAPRVERVVVAPVSHCNACQTKVVRKYVMVPAM